MKWIGSLWVEILGKSADFDSFLFQDLMTFSWILCASGISGRRRWLGYDLWQHRVLQVTFWRSGLVCTDNISTFSYSKLLVGNSSLLVWTLIPRNLGLEGVADHIYSWSWYNSTFIYPIQTSRGMRGGLGLERTLFIRLVYFIEYYYTVIHPLSAASFIIYYSLHG